MAIIINFAGASLRKPGAYSRVRVVQGGAAQAQLGVVALIGEADQGKPFSQEAGLSAVTYFPEQFNAIRDKYVSGQLVDGALLALTPSNDPQIQGGAQQLVLLKTNQSVAASYIFPPSGLFANYLALLSKLDNDAGVTGINYLSLLTPAPSLSALVASFNALLIKLDADSGVADTNYSSTLAIPGSPTPTFPIFSTAFNLLLTKLDADAGVVDTNYNSSLATTAGFYGTLVDKKAGAAGNNISVQVDASTSQVIITVSDAVEGITEISSAIGGTVLFTVAATEAAVSVATMTITSTTLTTALTGAVTSSNLNINLSQFNTISQLVEFINNQPGYAATIPVLTQQAAPLSAIDLVTAADIKTAPYSVTRNLADVVAYFAASALVDFTPNATSGLPAVAPKVFLSGGALGPTSQANFQNCLDALLKMRVNFITPLFSRDATSDIADSLTDPASAYVIASIHAAIRTHVSQASTVKGRKERQAWVGYQGTYANAKIASANLGSARVALCFQQVDVLDSTGSLVLAQPHMLAVVSAGLHAAAVVGLPSTFKLINISGFKAPSNDFDPEVDADDAIEANLTFVEQGPGGGFRFVLDNSTYGLVLDAWIYNRPSVLYASDTAAFSIRLNMETFIGKRNSDVSVETIKNLLLSVLDGLRSSGIIVPDASSSGKGFKDLVVSVNGSIINTSVTLILVEGYEFALNDIAVQRAVS